MQTEIWKDIENYEGSYRISNFGRVRSLKRYVKHNWGGKQIVKEMILKPQLWGLYYHVQLYGKQNGKRLMIHQLVAMAFIDPYYRKKKLEVNHIDGDKLNNHLSNLEVVTTSQNRIHAYALGLEKPTVGEINGMSKLRAEDVIEIRKSKASAVEVGKKYGINPSTVYKIRKRERWKHV